MGESTESRGEGRLATQRVVAALERRFRRPSWASVTLVATVYVALTYTLFVLGALLTMPVLLVDWTADVDVGVARWLAERRGPVSDAVARALSGLVSTPAVVATLSAVEILLLMQRRWREVAMLGVSVGLELAVYLTVTFVVARPRPDVAEGTVPITGSFPSGHAAMAVALWGALALIAGSMASPEWPWRGRASSVALGVAAATAFGVGLSRLHLGLHYLSDVIAGWLLGSACLAVAAVVGGIVARGVAGRWRADSPEREAVSGLVRASVVVVVGLVALTLWAVAVEPRFVLAVQEEEAGVPGLPPAWVGAEVAVVSDFQIGMWLDNVDMAHRSVETVVERRADIVLLLGDFVYGSSGTGADVDIVIHTLGPLVEAGIPTYAVLGNHDHDAGAAELLRRRFAAVGIQVLTNTSIELDPPREGSGSTEALHLVGIGPVQPGLASPQEAFDGLDPDAPRITMMHNPAAFADIAPGSAPFAVAGHTHGGQLRVPFLPDWSYLGLVQDDAVRSDGWIDGAGSPGNELFVNRGIGMSLVPARLNCSPAVTIFTLRPR